MENLEEVANYNTDTHCVQCRHSRSVVFRILLRAIHVIFIQRNRDIRCTYIIQCKMYDEVECLFFKVPCL
jgi:hypothetical protein